MLTVQAHNPSKTSSNPPPQLLTNSRSVVEESKQFFCKKCGVSFAHIETFKRHLNFYCSGKKDGSNKAAPEATYTQMMSSNNESPPTIAAANLAELLAIIQQQEQIQRGVRLQQDSIRMQSLLDPNGRGTQSTIILPVAHHQALDQALVQIIGPPQTVIPVAISRTLPVSSRPLLLDGSFLQSLRLPPLGRIPVGTSISNGFHLPLAFIQGFQPIEAPNLNNAIVGRSNGRKSGRATATATVTSMNALSPSLLSNSEGNKRSESVFSTASETPSKRRHVSEDKPLDLTINGKSDESAGSSSETVDTETELVSSKRFGCECGVSFLSLDTLTSHRRYYCRNRVVDEAKEQELFTRKAPSSCSQCNYVPATHAQLAQHIRHKHCPVQAYVCLLCGYKGYSSRGIKNHLRNSHTDEMTRRRAENGGSSIILSDKSLLQDYVFCVTNKTKQMSCSECRFTFPTTELLHNHKCPTKRATRSEGKESN